MNNICLILVVFFLFVTSCADKTPVSETQAPDTSKDTLPLSDLTFLRKRVNFNIVPKDTLLQARYPFVNIGKKDLIIEEVTPDCTCTGYFISKKTIHPGDSAYILLKYSTRDRFGEAKVYATVTANTPTRLYSLEILAKIRD